MLDEESVSKTTPEVLVEKIKSRHRDNGKLFDPKHCNEQRFLGIVHYAGPVSRKHITPTHFYVGLAIELYPHSRLCMICQTLWMPIEMLSRMTSWTCLDRKLVALDFSPTSLEMRQKLSQAEMVT